MRVLKLVPMFVLFLVLSGGQTILMLDETKASCCNPFIKGCVSWSGLVYGSAEPVGSVAMGTAPMFRITDDKGFTREIKASQAVADEFKKETITIDYGFSIVNSATGEPVLIAFVPVTNDHKKPQDSTTQGAGGVVADHNKLFEDGAKPPVKGKS